MHIIFFTCFNPFYFPLLSNISLVAAGRGYR